MRWMFWLLPLAHAASAHEVPADAGVINVRAAPYNAAGNGLADDTAAINAALNAARVSNTTGKIVYLPAGIYRVTDTLAFPEPRITLMGASRETTIIRLADNTAAFGNTGTPRNVVSTREASGFSANQFRVYVNDLTIDTGVGNPGAIGLKLHQNNSGGAHNLTIRSGDPQRVGVIGLDLRGTDKGPGLLRNLSVVGFDTGIALAGTEYSLTFVNLALSQQRSVGLNNTWNLVQIENLTSDNSVPVIRNNAATDNLFRWGTVVVIGGQLSGGNGGPAIVNDAHMYLRDVSASGYFNLITERSVPLQGLTAAEYIVPRQLSVWKTGAGSLKLPIESAPNPPIDPVANWVSVASFGANGADALDDAAAIRAAFASGAGTVYFPAGRYLVASTLTLGPNLRRVYFLESRIEAAAALPADAPLVAVGDGLSVEFYQGDFETGGRVAIAHTGNRTLLLRSGSFAPYEGSGSGRLLVEDVVGGPWSIGAQQQAHMRQINDETNGTKISNRGTLWMLGYKTEKQGSVIDNWGGSVELLGGLVYPVGTLPLEQPMVRNRGGALSLILGESAFVGGSDHKILVEDTRAGVTRRFFDREAPGRVGNGLGAHVTLYRSSADAGLPADGQARAHYCFSGNLLDCLGSNHGTGVGLSFVPSGIDGAALRLDGNSHVDLPGGLLGSAGGSVSLWLRTAAKTGDLQLLHYATASTNPLADGGGPDSELHLHLTAADRGALFIEGGSSDLLLQTPEAINNGQWRHLVATWQIGGFADLYLDGRRVAFAGPTSWNSFAGAVQRLGRPLANTRRYTGDLDEVRVFNRALRHDEVLDLYFGELPFTNYPPAVSAGPDRVLQRSDYALAIRGEAVDDGQPAATFAVEWSAPLGAGIVFDPANAALTTATFPAPGTYTLRLAASDGVASALDEMTTDVYAPLSAPWENGDIGAPAQDGWAIDSAARRMSLNAAGTAIAGNAATGGDQFHFVRRGIDGSAQELLACVDRFTASDANARAGLMFRGDLSPVAANALLALSGNGLVYQNRAGGAGNTSTTTIDTALSAPLCLRLARISTNQVQGSYSTDRGRTWIMLQPLTVNVGGGTKLIGLAHNSGSASRTQAVFSNLCFAATVPDTCGPTLEDFVRDGFE